MRYVFTYDIESDRIRTRIARLMSEYGDRVQLSVFECDLTEQDIAKLVPRLARILESRRMGTIRIYRVCQNCMKASLVVGRVPPSPPDEHCMIIG